MIQRYRKVLKKIDATENGLKLTKRKKIERKHCDYYKNISAGGQIEPDSSKNLQHQKTPIKQIKSFFLFDVRFHEPGQFSRLK